LTRFFLVVRKTSLKKSSPTTRTWTKKTTSSADLNQLLLTRSTTQPGFMRSDQRSGPSVGAQQSPASTTAALAVDQLEVIVVRRRAPAVGPGFEAEAYERKLAPRWRPEVVLGPRILPGLNGGADAGLAEV
jgi:hypothetical protein